MLDKNAAAGGHEHASRPALPRVAFCAAMLTHADGSGIWSDGNGEPPRAGLDRGKGRDRCEQAMVRDEECSQRRDLLAVAMAADLLLTLVICLRPSRQARGFSLMTHLRVSRRFICDIGERFARSGRRARSGSIRGVRAANKRLSCAPNRHICFRSALLRRRQSHLCAAMRAVPGPALWFAPLWLCTEWLSMRRCIRSVTDEDDLTGYIVRKLDSRSWEDGIAQFGDSFVVVARGAANK